MVKDLEKTARKARSNMKPPMGDRIEENDDDDNEGEMNEEEEEEHETTYNVVTNVRKHERRVSDESIIIISIPPMHNENKIPKDIDHFLAPYSSTVSKYFSYIRLIPTFVII